jgi:hypothetical protein
MSGRGAMSDHSKGARARSRTGGSAAISTVPSKNDQVARQKMAAGVPAMVRAKAQADKAAGRLNNDPRYGAKVTYSGVYKSTSTRSGLEHRYSVTGPSGLSTERSAASLIKDASAHQALMKQMGARGSAAAPKAASSGTRTRAPAVTTTARSLYQARAAADKAYTDATHGSGEHSHAAYVALQTARNDLNTFLTKLSPTQRASVDTALAKLQNTTTTRRSRAKAGAA